jgi:hypothetical protein
LKERGSGQGAPPKGRVPLDLRLAAVLARLVRDEPIGLELVEEPPSLGAVNLGEMGDAFGVRPVAQARSHQLAREAGLDPGHRHTALQSHEHEDGTGH